MSGKSIQKTKWNAEEDSHLIRLVNELGEGNWSPIARALNVVLGTLDCSQARTGKQCRERWSHHLKPDLKKGDWDAQEEAWLVSLHQDLGNKWADIARNIEGRSENSVKNHWNAVHRRCCKPNAQQEALSSPLLAYLLMLNLPPAKPKSGKVQASQARGQGRDKGREASTSPSQLELPGLGHSEPSGEGEGAVGEGEGAYPFGDDCLEPAVREREREGGTRAREASITTTGPSKRTARSSPRNPVDPQELPTSHAQHCHPPRLSCGGAPYPPAGLPSPLHPLPAMLAHWARPASSSGSDASGGSSGTGSGGATHPHPLSVAGGVRASPHAQAVLTGRQPLGSSSQMCSAGGHQEAVTLMCPEPDDITSLSQLSSHIHAHQHQQHQQQHQHQQQRASLGAAPNPAWPAGPNTYSLSATRLHTHLLLPEDRQQQQQQQPSPLPPLQPSPGYSQDGGKSSLPLSPGLYAHGSPGLAQQPGEVILLPQQRAHATPLTQARASYASAAHASGCMPEPLAPLNSTELLMCLFDTSSSELLEHVAYSLPHKHPAATTTATPPAAAAGCPTAPATAVQPQPPAQQWRQGQGPGPQARAGHGSSAPGGRQATFPQLGLASIPACTPPSDQRPAAPTLEGLMCSTAPPGPRPAPPPPSTQQLQPADDPGLAGLRPVHVKAAAAAAVHGIRPGEGPLAEGLLEELLGSPTALLCPVNRLLSQDVQLWWSGPGEEGQLGAGAPHAQVAGGERGAAGGPGPAGGLWDPPLAPYPCPSPLPRGSGGEGGSEGRGGQGDTAGGGGSSSTVGQPEGRLDPTPGGGGGGEGGGLVAGGDDSGMGPCRSGEWGERASKARRSEPGSVGVAGCKHRLEEGQEGGGAVRKVGEAEAATMVVCAWVEQNKGSSGGSEGKLDGGQAGSLLPPSANQCVAGGEDSSGATEVCLSVQHMRLGPQQQGVPWAVGGSLPRQESGSQPLPTAFRSTTLLTQQSQGLGQGQGQAWQRQPSLQSVLPDTPLAGLAPMQNVFAWPPALGRGARPDRHPSLGQGELHDGIMMSFSHTVMDSFLESMEHAGGDPMHTSLMQSGDFLMASNASKYGYPTAMCTEGTWA
ncbi:hypothetical protein QJQ45_005302 [Haematococcus lacustris]|nr:hypothetical protein QJQ45_005302 [Haematococcus lacustris]